MEIEKEKETLKRQKNRKDRNIKKMGVEKQKERKKVDKRYESQKHKERQKSLNPINSIAMLVIKDKEENAKLHTNYKVYSTEIQKIRRKKENKKV